MCFHLTKKEKQKKLEQAWKHTVVWSIQVQQRKILRTTSSLARFSNATTQPTPSKDADEFYPAQSELDTSPFHPATTPDHTDTTIAALTATLQDLKEQYKQIDSGRWCRIIAPFSVWVWTSKTQVLRLLLEEWEASSPGSL